MCRFPFALLMICAAANVAVAGDPEVFRVMPPGERVLGSGVPGIFAVLIVESVVNEQGGLLHSDLRGRSRLELGGTPVPEELPALLPEFETVAGLHVSDQGLPHAWTATRRGL